MYAYMDTEYSTPEYRILSHILHVSDNMNKIDCELKVVSMTISDLGDPHCAGH